MLATLAALAAGVCLPPAGSGRCIPVSSASGIAVLAMLLLGLLGVVAAAVLIFARYGRGERDITALLARPMQGLVSAGVTCLIGTLVLGLLLVPR